MYLAADYSGKPIKNKDMQHLAPFIVMIVLLVIIAVIILSLLNHRLKKQIIESSNINNSLLESLTGPGFRLEALKWGLILFFGGAGLVVLEFIPYESSNSPLPYGVEAIFIAAALLIYYIFLLREKKKN